MKKFLSSLLALTMILSLVIVPAQAESDSGYSIQVKSSIDIKGGESGNAEEVTATAVAPQGITPTRWVWSSDTEGVATVNGSSATATVTAVAAGTAKITCTMTVPAPTDENPSATAEKRAEVTVTVTNNAKTSFENSITKVTYQGRSYNITKAQNGDWSANVDYFADPEPATGLSVNGGSNVKISYTKPNLTVTSKTDATLTKNIGIHFNKVTPNLTMKADGTAVA